MAKAPHILVIKHSAFGDFVQALGVMRAIRQHHKGARITLLTTRPYVALAEASGYFDAVAVDPRPRWYDIPKILLLRRFLNEGKFARVYDLQNSERTGLYLCLFKLKPEWNGIAFGASHPFADDAARRSMHVFEALRAQVAVAGVSGVVPDDLSWLSGDISGIALPDPYVLVAAGCSPTRIQKRWPAENYIQLCQWLVQKGYTPVLLGTADEGDVNAAIAAACPQAVDLTGKTTLFQIPALARRAAGAVGNDTGPIQMIGPTGCPTLGLYPGFSNPRRHGPLGPHVTTILQPTMAEIGVDTVKEEMERLLISRVQASAP